MKRFLTRWYLLNKRLFKKPVFVLILCMVPILIVALNAVTNRSDGFVGIALAAEDPSDPMAAAITAKLSGGGAIRFTNCDSPEEAERQVRYGEADGAWIIKGDIAEEMDKLVAGDKNASCVKIVERKETIALKLAREKLASALSSDMCFAVMRHAYAEKVSADFDEAKLRAYYDNVIGSGELFEFRYASGEVVEDNDSSYLMLPIRGMLAAAVLLAGFAMALFWIRDEEQMVFARISRGMRPAFELGYHLTGICDVALAVLLSLYAAGLGTSLLREIASMAVCCLNCAVFVILIRRLLRRANSVAAATPLIIVAVIVVNPILFNLPFVYPIRILTPIYWYLQATHHAAFLGWGMLYFAIVAAIDLLLIRVSDRTRRG